MPRLRPRLPRFPRLLAFPIFALTLALYLPALWNGFIRYDDGKYVVTNRYIQHGLTPATLRWAFFNGAYASNWHPLTWLVHSLDWQLFGNNPAGHHAVSVLLHALNAALVFLLLQRLTAAPWRSAAVAMLFACHPMRVESVAWAAELKDVLSAFFGLASLWAYGGYAQHPHWRRYVFTAILLLLGLLAKPVLVTLPLVMLLLDFWPANRWVPPTPRRAAWLFAEKLPLLAVSATSCVVTFIAQRHTVAPLERLPLMARVANALVSYSAYLGKSFWPMDLAIYYPYRRWPAFVVVLAALLLAGITGAAVALRRRCPAVLVGWLWFVGMLVPMIGLVQVGSQAMADRYSYLPHVGLFLAVVWGLADLASRWRIPLAVIGGLGTVAVVAWSVTTFAYLRQWHDSGTLFRHAASVTRDNALAYVFIADDIDRQPGHHNDSLEYYRRAYEADPHGTLYASRYGGALIEAGQGELAEPILREAVRRDTSAPGGAGPRMNLGLLLAQTGRRAEAIELFRQATACDPEDTAAWVDLAKCLGEAGDVAGAARAAHRALDLAPTEPRVLHTIGSILGRSGEPATAVQSLARAVEIDPHNFNARFDLGLALMQIGQRQAAARQFQAVLNANPADREAQRALNDALQMAPTPPPTGN